MKSGRFIGVMSGTSLDGVDVVLATIDEHRVAQLASLSWPIPVSLKQAVLDICQGQQLTLSQFGQLDTQLGRLFADAVNALLKEQNLQARDIVAIGCHGQTVWHEPTGVAPHTLQIGDNNQIDPDWSQRIALESLNVDSFAQAWFAERKQRDPFDWAEKNLQEVERNKRENHTVPWRYVILRLHEAVQEIVPHLNEHDHKRFSKGLARVFIDNYATIPSESIRRLLALREAGIIHILALGEDYEMEINESRTVLKTEDNSYSFDVFIDARGQRPLKVKDIPFPGLREQLQKTGDEIPDVGEDYTLQQPEDIRGRVAFGALPWLMHDQPFVQGLTACAEIGEAMARAVVKPASRARRRLSFNQM